MASKKREKYWRPKYKPSLIDIAALAELPDEGTRLGLHEIGINVPGIHERLVEKYGHVDASAIAGRMQAMKYEGLAVSVVLVPKSQGVGWQITPKGKAMLDENKGMLPTTQEVK